MNFTETTSVQQYPREFLAVILAGFGNELQPLTSNYGDQPCPKALLPIGNRPMISYVLNWIEEAGLKDVLLICPSSHVDPISHYINSDPSSSSLPNLSIDIQTYDQSQDIPAGTAGVLAHFASRITNDFVLLPCDFLPPPSLRLETVLNKFRVETSSDGALATALFFEQRAPGSEKSKAAAAAVEEAWAVPPTPLPIVYDAKTGTLLHMDTLDDQDRDGDELAVRMCALWAYPRTTLSTRLVDAHVYVCRHTVLDLLQVKKARLDSFREEFIPWLCKIHTQRAKRARYAKVLSPIASANNSAQTQTLALEHSTLHVPALQKLKTPSSRGSTGTSPSVDEDESDVVPPSYRVGLVVHPSSKGYTARANHLQGYLELNRAALGTTAPPTHDPALRALIDPKANVTADSLIGSSTRVGERSTVKRCAIGSHCIIGKNVKLTGCVLMEYCVVEDGAKLEGCLLGKNTRVGEKAELVRCVTQAGFEADAGGVYKHEKLEVSDWTTGANESEEEEEDGQEEEESGDGDS